MFSFRKFRSSSIIPYQSIHLSIFSRNRPCKHDGPCDSRSNCPCFVNKAHCRNTCRCAKACKCVFYFVFITFSSPSPQANEDGKAVLVPRLKKHVGQRNVLVSKRMLNVIPRYAFRVVQSTYRYLFSVSLISPVRSTNFI